MNRVKPGLGDKYLKESKCNTLGSVSMYNASPNSSYIIGKDAISVDGFRTFDLDSSSSVIMYSPSQANESGDVI
jgi:hypothetical protein